MYATAAQTLLETVNLDSRNIHEWAILDSGATSHFLVSEAPTSNRQIAETPLKVRLPDGAHVSSTHTCHLDIPKLPQEARHGHIIPGLASHSLLSVVKLCNAGCEVSFTKIDCTVRYRGRVVLTGKKCTKTGLWMVPVSEPADKPINHATNVARELQHASMAQEMMATTLPTSYPSSDPASLAMYLHQMLCSPPKSALLKAIRNHQLDSIPGLSYELIANHLLPSTATEKGHMIRTRQGLRSTRAQRQQTLDARELVDDMQPPQQICSAIDDEMFCYAALADQHENTIYNDLAGRFPVRAFSGSN